MSGGVWDQMDCLLKCAICNDRYRNPKLLPCQHTFCMEPCLEKVADNTRHQVKCPDCGAEHRIPFQGVQAFPNNVTLVRFLELRVSLNGETPEPPPSMQRCAICCEKEKLEKCSHCNKKVCQACKKAHSTMLRQEIVLIHGQVKLGLTNLTNILNQTGKNKDKLEENYKLVKQKVDELVRRYTSDLQETEDKLKHELDVYLYCEVRNITKLRNDLEIELKNITSNCELVEKHMSNGVEWTDIELMDYKEIFQRTLDFVRNFEPDTSDFSRRVRFHSKTDPDTVRKLIRDFAKLENSPAVVMKPSLPNGLIMRSQSDHRLAMQLQRNEANREDGGDRELPFRRNIRERSVEREIGRHEDYLSPWRRDDVHRNRGQSREGSPEPRFFEERPERILETEDATKGPISKVVRLLDSPQVLEKLHQTEVRQKQQQKEQERKAQQPPPRVVPTYQPTRQLQRQLSEDDVDKQKRQNQAAAAASSTATSAVAATDKVEPNRPKPTETTPAPKPREEVRSWRSSLNETTPKPREEGRSWRSPPSSDTTSKPREEGRSWRSPPSSDTTPKPREEGRSWRSPPSSDTTPKPREEGRSWRSPPSSDTTPKPREETRTWRSSSNESVPKPREEVRSWKSPPNETDTSGGVGDSSRREAQKPPVSPRQSIQPLRPVRSATAKTNSTESEDKTRPTPTKLKLNPATASTTEKSEETTEPRKKPFVSRFLVQRKPVESKDSDSSDSSSESEDDADTSKSNRGDLSPSVNELLARSAHARRQSLTSQHLGLRTPLYPSKDGKSWRDNIKHEKDSPNKDSSITSRRRRPPSEDSEEEVSPYVRYSERRRSLAAVESSSPLSDRNRFRNRIARSKSSHDIALGEESEEDSSSVRSRLRQARIARETSPVRESGSYSQYLKNKYGQRSRTRTGGGGGTDNSSDEEEKVITRRRDSLMSRYGDNYGTALSRRTYMQKGKSVLKFGARGSEPGCFTWPRGVAVGQDVIAVADSSNHRVQIFNSNGKFLHEFGSYGSGEGEFDCLAAVTVAKNGHYIISDRYNHRLQVFDPTGRFIRCFGSEGRADGKFSYPWGLAADSLGFIYVCDKENHRIQVFQMDGTYVSKFGSMGSRPGELEHPHYIAVSNTNRVIVSDSNNHRIQIYDVNGRHLSSYGSEGTDEGQFKFPRGVAIDEQGYVIVGDSGNNRIQVFNPDGSFLKEFGKWGSGDGEFKGLEGITVNTTGGILVCDRENHRIQVF